MDIEDSGAKIRDLEHIMEEKEREIQMLRDSIHEYNNSNPVSEDRIIALERDLKEISGLVRGLTAEVLDLKACVQKFSKFTDDGPLFRREEVKSKNYPVVESPKVVAERKSAEKVRSALKEDTKEELPEEIPIMQPDGTIKREVKAGDDMIVADHRTGRMAGNGKTRRPGERDPIDRKPLIYADDDDDTIEIKRRRK